MERTEIHAIPARMQIRTPMTREVIVAPPTLSVAEFDFRVRETTVVA